MNTNMINDEYMQEIILDTASEQNDQKSFSEIVPETVASCGREGMDAIKEAINHGIKLIGAYKNGAAIASGSNYEIAFTSDIEEIQNLMQGIGDKHGNACGAEIELFRFRPADAGFLCIDIDRGHKNNIDGLSEFYKMFEDFGIYRPGLPAILKDIEHESFPVYMATPSGGFHLYFRYKGNPIRKCVPAPNVEIFHTKSGIAAPGSYKNGKPYILYGNLDDTPQLPPIIERIIRKSATSKPQEYSPPQFTYERAKDKDVPTLEKLAEWAEKDKSLSGRNELCFEIARRTSRKGYHYTINEVIGFLKNYPSTSGHDQIEDAVRSAFRYKK